MAETAIKQGKEVLHEWEEGGMKAVRGIARSGPGCHNTCGIISYIKEGRLVKVEGDPESSGVYSYLGQ